LALFRLELRTRFAERVCPLVGQKGDIMSESELKYPSWQTPLQEAILEFDREKLAEQIQAVENLIFERLQAIASDTNHHDEQQALANAAFILRKLKKEKLS
jgi:hypothetical protein